MTVAYEENTNFPAFMFIRELSILEENIDYPNRLKWFFKKQLFGYFPQNQ